MKKVPDLLGAGLAQCGEAISELGAQVLLHFGMERRLDELEVYFEYLWYKIWRRTEGEQLRFLDHFHGGLKKFYGHFLNTTSSCHILLIVTA